MKKTIYLLTLVSLCLLMNSCNNDDDSTTEEQSNFLKIENTEYELTNGISEDYSDFPENDVYNIDLTLLTSEFTVNGNDYSGNGRSIYFEIFSSTPNKLPTGIYEYNLTQNPLSFDDAIIYDNSNGEELEIEINSGTITITRSENNYYELTFECVDKMNRTITGRYFGNVNYVPNLVP